MWRARWTNEEKNGVATNCEKSRPYYLLYKMNYSILFCWYRAFNFASWIVNKRAKSEHLLFKRCTHSYLNYVRGQFYWFLNTSFAFFFFLCILRFPFFPCKPIIFSCNIYFYFINNIYKIKLNFLFHKIFYDVIVKK